MAFLASIFGTILYFIYNLVNNYGFAIILFSILLKKENLSYHVHITKN